MINLRNNKIATEDICTNEYMHIIIDDGCYGKCMYCGKLKEHIDRDIETLLIRDRVIAKRKGRIPKKLLQLRK